MGSRGPSRGLRGGDGGSGVGMRVRGAGGGQRSIWGLGVREGAHLADCGSEGWPGRCSQVIHVLLRSSDALTVSTAPQ